MNRLIVAALVAASLAGCSVCQTHPRTCTAVGAIALTSVALSLGGSDQRHEDLALHDPNQRPCTPQPNGSCR